MLKHLKSVILFASVACLLCPTGSHANDILKVLNAINKIQTDQKKTETPPQQNQPAQTPPTQSPQVDMSRINRILGQNKAATPPQQFQPIKETPKETRKLKSITIDIEYPFLIGENFITSISHLIGTNPQISKLDIADLLRVTIHNNTNQEISGLNLTARVLEYSNPAIETVDVPAKESVTVTLNPTFKDSLLDLVEQRPGSIYLSITSADGKSIYKSTKRITLLSRNDTILQFRPLLGVFVTPNDKRINELISYAAEKVPGRTMAGYQRDQASVITEMRAIYDTISELGIHYRSSTLSFLDSKDLNAQRTYFPAESLEATGANCLDGSLLFASALENIGLETEIVFPPGHAFVGARLQRGQSSSWLFIETTMVGNATFDQAVKSAGEQFNKHMAAGTLSLLDINQIRQMGVKPFPSAVGSKEFSLKDKLQGKSEKIFDIQLVSAFVPSKDLGGMPPMLYVAISQNDKLAISTKGVQRWVGKDNPNVLYFNKQNIKKRITLTKADEILFAIYQEGFLQDTRVLAWKLTWDNFVAKDFTMQSESGAYLQIAAQEIR
jgi:hypothetical protein